MKPPFESNLHAAQHWEECRTQRVTEMWKRPQASTVLTRVLPELGHHRQHFCRRLAFPCKRQQANIPPDKLPLPPPTSWCGGHRWRQALGPGRLSTLIPHQYFQEATQHLHPHTHVCWQPGVTNDLSKGHGAGEFSKILHTTWGNRILWEPAPRKCCLIYECLLMHFPLNICYYAADSSICSSLTRTADPRIFPELCSDYPSTTKHPSTSAEANFPFIATNYMHCPLPGFMEEGEMPSLAHLTHTLLIFLSSIPSRPHTHNRHSVKIASA